MHCGKPLPFKATAARTAAAVVATPHFGRRQQHPCSSLSCGRPSQSSYLKLRSISSRDLQQSSLPTASHIPRATKDDDDAIAPPAAGQPYMPEEWPDFSQKVDPAVHGNFFNRKEEFSMIIEHLKEEPTVPLLLLGPKNSGKSALLKSIIEKEKSRVLYLNCGLKDVSSPELMAMELRDQARKIPSMLDLQLIKLLGSQIGSFSKVYELLNPDKNSTAAVKAAASTENVIKAFFEDFFPEDKATDLRAIIRTYELLLKNIPQGQKKPVVVIDEANALTLWKTKDAVALKQLLDFFKRSCKEEHTVHVVLATSEFFLVSWLQSKGFDENVRRVEVVGDLASAEAFVYVCGGKVLSKEGVEEEWPGLIAGSEETLALGMTPEDWKKVWSVCGGNIHLLRNCVDYAKQYKSWDKGVRKILSEPQKAVATALEFPELIPPPTDSSAPRSWESEHYKAVLRLIATNPYHAVPRKEVHAALRAVGIPENITPAQVLLSMVEYNVVSLRPYSDMAQDIPRKAFFKQVGKKEKENDVVTMPSPAHLAAVLELDVELEEKQEESKTAQDAKDEARK